MFLEHPRTKTGLGLSACLLIFHRESSINLECGEWNPVATAHFRLQLQSLTYTYLSFPSGLASLQPSARRETIVFVTSSASRITNEVMADIEVSSLEDFEEVDTDDDASFGIDMWDGLFLVSLRAAIIQNEPFERILDILIYDPDQVRERHLDGSLPLPIAAEHAPLEVVQRIACEWQRALQERDDQGRLPLHVAAERGSLEVVQLLASMRPQALAERSGDGSLALHCAAGGSSLDVVQLLAKLRPRSVFERRHDGYLPLHVAARRGSALGIVQFLVHRGPLALKEKCGHGWLPLHLADVYATWAVVQCIVKRWTQALRERKNHGMLPLHAAAAYGSASAVARLLANLWPPALRATTCDGSLPLRLAVGGHYDTVEALTNL
jgi:ankyrin repeat protein